MKFTFSNDNIECFLIIDKKISYEYDELKKALIEKDITFGVDDAKLIDICEKSVFKKIIENKVLVAKGLKPREGKNGSITFLIQDGISITHDEKDRVDFYNIGLIKTVYKNQKLSEIIPPTIGQEGYNVFGKRIPGKLGKVYPIDHFLNSSVSLSDDGNFLLANKSGYYEKQGNQIYILERIDIIGDLNYSVGNIDTTSIIFISGDVLSGFSCNTKSSIHVNGVIENASMIVGDSIICKTGITKGSAEINAGDQIRTKYIANRKNIICNDLVVEKFIHYSEVFCKHQINVPMIIGGDIHCQGSIIVNTVGNIHFQKTVLRVGFTENELERFEKCGSELNRSIIKFKRMLKSKMKIVVNIEKEIVKLKDKIASIPDYIASNLERLLESKYDFYDKTKDEINPIIREMISLHSIYKRLNKHKQNNNIFVHITGTVWPGSYIVVNSETSFKVTHKMRNSFFKCDRRGKLIIERDRK